MKSLTPILLTSVLMLLFPESKKEFSQTPLIPNLVKVQQQEIDIIGIYKIDGTNPDGSKYAGVAEILKNKDTFQVKSRLGDGSEVIGLGILNGDLLSVSYQSLLPVIAVYKIEVGRLVGQWSMNGFKGSTYPETLIKVNMDDIPKLENPGTEPVLPVEPSPRRRIQQPGGVAI